MLVNKPICKLAQAYLDWVHLLSVPKVQKVTTNGVYRLLCAIYYCS